MAKIRINSGSGKKVTVNKPGGSKIRVNKPEETYYILDEYGNNITDEDGNKLSYQ